MIRHGLFAALIVVAGALACTSSHAATPERFDAAPVKKTFAKNYKFVPMLLVTHEAGGDALASEPLDAALSDEPFKTVTDTTHWGMVEGNTYYHLPSFDIYAVANLLPRSDPNKNPLEEMKAKPGGFMLTQFITPNCKSCDKLAQTLVQWMETNKARPMRWVVVDLSTSNLRGCWKGYRFVTTGWRAGKLSSERAECLK